MSLSILWKFPSYVHNSEELDAGFDKEEFTAAAAGEVAPANW
jgi:hypothetical protein